MARSGAREEKIGDVRARDQEHAANRAEQGIEDGSHVAHCVIEHRRYNYTPAFVRIGILAGKLRGEHFQFRARLRNSHPR